MRTLAIMAGVIAAICGAVWALTASAAQACSITGQLEGRTCYPELQNLHTITGPVALVAGAAAAVMLIAAPRDATDKRPADTRPPCARCGQPASALRDGMCPVPPPGA